MSTTGSEISHSPSNRRRNKILFYVLGVPVFFVLFVGVAYKYNNRPVLINFPVPTMPVPNAYDDFVRAGSLAMAMVHKSPFDKTSTTYSFAEFEAAAKDAQPALAAMRKGLDEQYLNPPVRSQNDGMIVYPKLTHLRGLARVVSTVSVYDEMAGKLDTAAETRLDGIQMSVMMYRGGDILRALVAIACEAIGSSRFEPLIPKLSDQELAHAASRLDAIAAQQTSFAEILREEGRTTLSEEAEMLRDPKKNNFSAAREMFLGPDDLAGGTGPNTSERIKANWQALQFVLASKQRLLAQNQAYFDALYKEALGPYKVVSTVAIPNNYLAQTLAPLVNIPHQKVVSMQAMISLYRTEVALERFKRAVLRYPSSLAQLTPTYLSTAALTDPFTGAPFHYRIKPAGDRYLLYSVGPDLVDNQGMPSKTVGSTPGDIVAGHMWNIRTFKK